MSTAVKPWLKYLGRGGSSCWLIFQIWRCQRDLFTRKRPVCGWKTHL